MKKVLISIIIILTILLIGQGIYYSLDIKEENINESRENSISNTMRIFNDVNTVEKIENVIVPDGMDEFIKKYSGSQKIIPLEKNFYEFIYTTVPNITNDNAIIIIHSNTFLFLSLSFLLFLFFVFSLFLLSFNFITSKPILIHCFLLVYLQFLDFLVLLAFSLFLFVFLFHVCF